jgi:hypothetical protein
MNGKECGKEQMWPDLRKYPETCLVRKPREISIKISGLQDEI